MKSNIKTDLQAIEKCIITTSTPLPDFYEKIMSRSKVDGLLIYSCLYAENTETIPASHHYEILIDFTNKNIYNIILKMFNKLLRFDCNLHVKIQESPIINAAYIESSMKLLRKLESKNLIRLSIQKSQIRNAIKELLEDQLENVACFVGPGNTGKTSIIASLSEFFCQENQRIALLDITKKHKLKGYFPYSSDVSSITMDNADTHELHAYFEAHHRDHPHLYTLDPLTNNRDTEIHYLCKVIKKLSSSYDFLLINTDEHIVSNFVDIFKLFNSIFIVHDCMLNKIHPTHKMLLNIYESGIDTHKAVSMIYNKVVKKASNIGNIEEKLIFQKDENGHLLPLIDIKCMTIEISHNRKVASALNNKIISKIDALDNASLYYQVHIKRLYNFINNIEDFEYSDLHLSEFLRDHSREVFHQFFSMKKGIILKYKAKLNTVYAAAKIVFGKWTGLARDLRSRYFKDKFQKVFK